MPAVATPSPTIQASSAAQSPAIRALQRERPPSIAGSASSTKSARELLADPNAPEEKTVFIPQPLFTFLTSPDHTVTACLANSTVDSPVRVIAEHLYGLDYGSYKFWTGEADESDNVKQEVSPKGVRALLNRLKFRRHRSRLNKSMSNETTNSVNSDNDDVEQVVEDYYSNIRWLNQDELAEVRRCGEWRGAEPSELFLNIYGHSLLAMEKYILNGLISPPLMGASGVAPLTIISHTSDILHHYSDLLVRAEREVFFTTSIWEASESATAFSDALKELSRRVVERGGDRVVIKLMYDRGVSHDGLAHKTVHPSEYTSAEIGLPSPDDVPGLELEVQNYHIPPVGSFHQKCVVVDRKLALLSSNNVQERGDVGFMVQLEGPIVQSIYDSAILSWWTSLDPPPPLIHRPPHYHKKLTKAEFQWGEDHPAIASKEEREAMAERTRQRLAVANNGSGQASAYDPSDQLEADRVDTAALENSVSDGDDVPFNPIVLHAPHDPYSIAMVNRTPRARRGKGDGFVPQNQAWLSAVKFAKKSIFIQTPTFTAKPIVAAVLEAVKRGVLVEIYADLEFNNQGEISTDGAANQAMSKYMYSQLNGEEISNLRVYWYTAKGQTSPMLARHTCHIKLMIVDDAIAVTGNGNLSHVSWFHSQELNILVDSPQMCADWRAGIDSNQNTGKYGRVQSDGVWRDKDGKTLPTIAVNIAVNVTTPTPPVQSRTSLSVSRTASFRSVTPTTPPAKAVITDSPIMPINVSHLTGMNNRP